MPDVIYFHQPRPQSSTISPDRVVLSDAAHYDGLSSQHIAFIVDGYSDSIAGMVDHAEEARRAQFCALADDWHANTGHLSSVMQIATHGSYQRIIGMGSEAVPYILEDLRDRGGQWYWALHSITGESPVPDDAAGKISRMKAHWLDWGKSKGLVTA